MVYDLPIGPDRKYLSEGALGKVIGGWKVTSVVTIGSGFPLTIGAGEDTANIGNCCRPNRDFERRHGHRQSDDRASGSTRPPTPGRRTARSAAAGRSEVIGPGIMNWDFSTSKDFHINSTDYIQFRFEAFNFLNHPNWGDPEYDVQQRGVRHDQFDPNRDAPVAVRVEAGFLEEVDLSRAETDHVDSSSVHCPSPPPSADGRRQAPQRAARSQRIPSSRPLPARRHIRRVVPRVMAGRCRAVARRPRSAGPHS